jgi:magnesium transporter
VPDERWIDFLDADEATLRAALPDDLHDLTWERILRRADDPRPRLSARGTYVFGVLTFPVLDGTNVKFQEVVLVATVERLWTIRKSPPSVTPEPFATARAHAIASDASSAMCLHALIDEIAEQFLDVVECFDEVIDDLEDHVTEWEAARIRAEISATRHDLLHVRKVLAPTRDAARNVLDDRVELDGDVTLFPRETELQFADTYDKLLRATDQLDLARDLLQGVRDFHQSEIANDQNEVMKRLTAIASLLLVPTFIVGFYGQNFIHMPELRWRYGYWFSWALIVSTTLFQLWFYRRKRWI